MCLFGNVLIRGVYLAMREGVVMRVTTVARITVTIYYYARKSPAGEGGAVVT
jgi:hypothetical protein